MSITVMPDETTSDVGSEMTSQPASSASDRRLPLRIGLLIAAMLIAAWLSRPSWSAWLEARRQRQAESERVSYARVEQACRDNDATKAFNALMAWIDQTIPSTQANTLELFSQQVSDSTLTQELERLQHAVVRRDTNWNGQPLSDALNRFRRHRDASEKRSQSGRTALPDLNP